MVSSSEPTGETMEVENPKPRATPFGELATREACKSRSRELVEKVQGAATELAQLNHHHLTVIDQLRADRNKLEAAGKEFAVLHQIAEERLRHAREAEKKLTQRLGEHQHKANLDVFIMDQKIAIKNVKIKELQDRLGAAEEELRKVQLRDDKDKVDQDVFFMWRHDMERERDDWRKEEAQLKMKVRTLEKLVQEDVKHRLEEQGDKGSLDVFIMEQKIAGMDVAMKQSQDKLKTAEQELQKERDQWRKKETQSMKKLEKLQKLVHRTRRISSRA